MTGLLVLVVGPSGSGKDTLLGGAAQRLATDLRFSFARRTVTRVATDEDHETVDVPTFLARLAQGDFALHWEAHGLHYGIPVSTLVPLAEGGIVVANVSRGVIPEAQDRYPVAIAEITAPVALRASRLAARGREDPGAIAARLSREVPPPSGARVHRIINDARIEDGVCTLVALMRDLAEQRESAL